MCIYGDPAYPHRIYLQCPFARRQELTPAQQGVNQSMSEVRVSVDWVFGDVVKYFTFIDFKKNLKIGLSAMARQKGKKYESIIYNTNINFLIHTLIL